ncbi:MAG: hypothetical protein KBD63_01985 [Bacteriovoracaceae bacterium]|nr:hypothetical protein [Bacteriovoracaceae bacterium]
MKFFIPCFGQAVIEYLFVLIFISFIGTKMIKSFGGFMGNSMGNVAHVLSSHLTVGVCPTECFFTQYKNGYDE